MRAGRLQPVLRSLTRPQYLLITRRTFANIRNSNPLLAFTPATPQHQDPSLHRGSTNPQQPDERTLKLGKTLQALQPRLPTLLASPLPQEILSPHISLHLFPSTHPHLPTVSGRVAYHAALWTSPITWGKIPLVGNVNLEILSERMVRRQPQQEQRQRQRQRQRGESSGNSNSGSNCNEKLIVRWRTLGKTKGLGTGAGYKGIGGRQSVDKITAWLGGDEKRDDREFCGKFIFEFDEEGRILDHVIERAEEGWDAEQWEQWEQGFGRVVGLTDWLLGRLGGKEKEAQAPAGVALGCVDGQARNRESRRY